tara:strand:- start:718 stop:1173 length:456 start_codon:yes stop_codon:yes gene_type:complete
MNLIRIFLVLFIISCLNFSAMADNHSKKEEVVDKAKEITKKLQEDGLDEVPLNDPFAGNEGSNRSGTASVEVEEDEMSLYNFKLVGLISGTQNSYVSLANSGGEVFTLTLGQYLGKIKLVDMRLTEVIFQKEDKKYMIIDFNNLIREADEY